MLSVVYAPSCRKRVIVKCCPTSFFTVFICTPGGHKVGNMERATNRLSTIRRRKDAVFVFTAEPPRGDGRWHLLWQGGDQRAGQSENENRQHRLPEWNVQNADQ